jgi:signal transduction histidine kinase
MGAPVTGIKAAEDSSAEALFSAFNDDLSSSEKRRHATVYNYWLSIRGDRQFPPIRDLDPLEISDAGPSSALLELIGGGEDAEIRHLGQAIKDGVTAERISEAPRPSLLSCIAKQLPIISNARQALAFEDEFVTAEGTTRCWVTLLPFSSTGTYVDYVYGLVSLKSAGKAAETPLEIVAEDVAPEEVAELAPMAIDRGYDLSLEAPDGPVIVQGDGHAISRAITNLVSNAVIHGGGGGRIQVVVGRDGIIAVEDEGPGVPSDLAPALFEPFWRGNSSAEGCGLGLHLTRERSFTI